MAVGELERSEIRAARCEMDLSGGTVMVPRRVLAGSMRVLSGMETGYLGLGQLAVLALGEVSE